MKDTPIQRPSPRKEAQQLVDQYKLLFAAYTDRPVRLAFGPHSITTRIKSVSLARLSDVKNMPEKRPGDKAYTPPAMLVSCDDGDLFFVVEDIRQILLTLNGIRVIMGDDYSVTFSEVV